MFEIRGWYDQNYENEFAKKRSIDIRFEAKTIVLVKKNEGPELKCNDENDEQI